MKIGIVGSRGSGKTAIFNLLTGNAAASQKSGYSIGVATVHDSRIDFLSDMYKPKKTIYAQITVVDFAGLGGGQKDSEASKQAKSVDALLLVLGAFVKDPVADLDDVSSDLIISDLGQVERALERVDGKRSVSAEEVTALKTAKQRLDDGKFIGDVAGLPDGHNLITSKPIIAALNVGEENLVQETTAMAEATKRCEALGIPVVKFCATVESDIASMEPEDRAPFMAEYHIEESGVDRLARAAYGRLGVISFFTVGPDEVRAWTIDRDCPAKKAAGAIHSDIERGFIRAEVVAYEDLHRLGSMKSVKEAGLFRLEAKEYPVKDGDIVSFRFNV